MAIHHDKVAYGKLASMREELSENRISTMLSLLEQGGLADLHMHTRFSHDSSELPERYMEKAVELGKEYIGFSEHYDYDNALNGDPTALPDLKEYDQTVRRLRAQYGDRITLLKGIELGFDKRAEGEYKRVLSENAFDYVINSVHTLAGLCDCYFPKFFAGKTQRQAYADYLNAVYDSVNADYDYQIVGHIGYVSRYAEFTENALLYRDYPDLIDSILKAVISRGASLEINTSVGKSGSEFLPDESVLLRYFELGGEKITYGSDAHSADKYALREDKAARFLRKCGIKRTCVYVGKQCVFLDL